ncbi:MAG: class I SAM-dependent methyltransferase [Chloroflexota bacterium]|nr:class I SAM-dependent methyltransferase [Dehalococcoidia bacterium]MDW8252505.1 class I SAM-dependent methyltransferase [Chloroflexota bacterium]
MTRCPVCGGDRFAVRVRTPRLTVVRCRRCGLHLNALPPAAEGGDYYAALDLDDYLAYYEPFRLRVFRENWRWIAARRPTGTALDIGASFGWFLRAAPPGWRVRGLEPAAEVAARGRAQGLDIRVGGIDALEADPERYDLITLWNVFEHLPAPRRVLRLIHRRLGLGGLLALSVPNRDGLYNRLAYAAYDLSGGRVVGPLFTLFQVNNPAPHLFHYAPRDLRRLLRAAGFEVLAIVPQPIVDVRRLALRAKLEPGRSVASSRAGRALMIAVEWLSRLLRLPDEIAVYAQARYTRAALHEE